VMPARLGELFRAEFLKQDFGLSRISALTSIPVYNEAGTTGRILVEVARALRAAPSIG
jgi:hypothetical protein